MAKVISQIFLFFLFFFCANAGKASKSKSKSPDSVRSSSCEGNFLLADMAPYLVVEVIVQVEACSRPNT